MVRSRTRFLLSVLAGVTLAVSSLVQPAFAMNREVPAKTPDKVLDWNGVKVHYQDTGGEGLPLVFIPGWACDHSFWRFQIPGLKKLGRLLIIDLPGHGLSSRPLEAYSMDYLAQSVAAVLDREKIEKAVLIGHSNGTAVIRQFFRLHPGRTRALVVVDGSLRPVIKDPKQAEMILAPLRAEDYKPTAELIINGMLPPTLSEDLRVSIQAAMLRTHQEVMVGTFEAYLDPSIWTEDKITVPLLLVHAESPFWNEGYEKYVRTLAPHADYRTLSGVSHFLMMEVPEKFNGIVIDFLIKNQLLPPAAAQ